MNIKKKTGLALLAFVVCCWGITPILPFLDFPNKAIIITTLLITNEVLFIITIALLGNLKVGCEEATQLQFRCNGFEL